VDQPQKAKPSVPAKDAKIVNWSGKIDDDARYYGQRWDAGPLIIYYGDGAAVSIPPENVRSETIIPG